MAINDPKGIEPFTKFLDIVNTTTPQQLQLQGVLSGVSLQAATEMHAFLLQQHVGVESIHSFADDNGSIFDCVPIEKQVGLRGTQGSAAVAPDSPRAASANIQTDQQDTMIPGLSENRLDTHGNAMFCPPGAIPVRRITAEGLSRFQTLQQFMQKSPGGSQRPPHAGGPDGDAPNIPPSTTTATHRWAHAFQNVPNLGGHSFINVWDPPIGANQIFALSQHWYVAGSGTGLQTAEVGWQVYPQLYGNSKPVFFIYWTADGYNKTGCYNLSCPAFVQTSNKWTIGGTLAPVSVQNGQQFGIDVSFYLHAGRWWLYVGGGAASNAIGYYPASIYKGGAMASHATEIDYGGETVGTTSWPPMGSGKFANTGWQHAAYQRDIKFFPPAGGVTQASLTAAQASPQCYTVTVAKKPAPWNETIFFGGPGGANC